MGAPLGGGREWGTECFLTESFLDPNKEGKAFLNTKPAVQPFSHWMCVLRLSGDMVAGVLAPAGGPCSEGTALLNFPSTDALAENSWEEEPAGVAEVAESCFSCCMWHGPLANVIEWFSIDDSGAVLVMMCLMLFAFLN